MKALTKNEPVTLATIIALAVGALASYGLNITDELAQFLTIAVPVLIAMVFGRSQVTPVGKAEANQDAAYRAGKNVSGQRTGTAADRAGEGVSR